MKYLGLGTAAIGRPQYINIRKEKTTPFDIEAFKQNGIAVLDAAYEKGIRYFDTAPGYGLAEQLLLDWVQEKGDSSIEVATKWGYTYVADFDPNATQHEVKEHSLAKLNEQWEVSRRLLPYLTTYQIHSATFESGILENEAVLQRLAELKDTHNLLMGLTVTGANQVDVLRKAITVEVDGKRLFDAFQVTYNVLDQSLAGVAELLKAEGGRIIIKEALANGRMFPNERFPQYQKLYQTLQKMAQAYGVEIDAIGLRFCVDSLSPYKVLSGVSNTLHLTDNVKVEDFVLSENDIAILKNFRIDPGTYWKERKALTWN